jgi:hypothetical protein
MIVHGFAASSDGVGALVKVFRISGNTIPTFYLFGGFSGATIPISALFLGGARSVASRAVVFRNSNKTSEPCSSRSGRTRE